MFKVTFRDERSNQDLTKKPLLLDAIPDKGEMVYVREHNNTGSSRPAQAGQVTARHWYIATLEPDESEVIIVLSMQK